MARTRQILAALDWRKAGVVAASLALVVLIAVTLARLVWLVIEGPPMQPSADAVPDIIEAPAMPAVTYTPEMASRWTLFGDASILEPGASAEDAPATSLSLQLLGTFSTGDARLAGAVIGERGRDGELYRIGATLPGGAVLEKVEASKVLLRRRGQLETLSFDAAPSAGMSGDGDGGAGLDMAAGFRNMRERLSTPPQFTEDGEPVSRAQAVLSELQEDLQANPDGVLSDYGLRPVNAGASAGYVVGEGTNSDVMKSLGLRPGDVVLSVNGKPLGNIRSDARMIDEVKASGEARVEIRRNTQTFTVNYPL